jgi:hypothetical protein
MHVDWGDSEVAGSRRGSREDIGGHQFVDHGIHLLSPSAPPQGLSVFLKKKRNVNYFWISVFWFNCIIIWFLFLVITASLFWHFIYLFIYFLAGRIDRTSSCNSRVDYRSSSTSRGQWSETHLRYLFGPFLGLGSSFGVHFC